MKEFTKEEVVELTDDLLKHLRINKVSFAGNLITSFLKEKGLIEEEFEIDKWYRRGDDFIYYTCEFMNYGIIDGQWRNDLYFSTAQEQLYISATDKEVEEALIKEAKKRGFKDGDWIVKNIDYEYYNSEDSYYPNSLQLGVVVLFQEGKWLEIIEEKIETPLEVIINGETYIKK